jgi:Protein of unknown function (DUF3617)
MALLVRSRGCAVRWILLIVSALAAPIFSSFARADEPFEGPKFRRGEWHFMRTLEATNQGRGRVRLLERDMTRCVDPTEAMRATFSSPSVGNCHSAKPERVANKYIFSKRCDYMGPVSTVITVQSDEAYTEVNELTVGRVSKIDLVVAQRVGDCHDDGANLARRSDLLIPH